MTQTDTVGREYTFVYVRQYEAHGYRTVPQPLPNWLKVEIRTEGDSKVAYVHSRIHVNRVVALNPTFSTDFSDADILKDLSAKILSGWVH